MAEEYRSTCKDCGEAFGYSQASLQSGSARGLTRPERCPRCRKTHSRESRSIGIPQITIKPLGKRKEDKELTPGRLGGISHPPRTHEKVELDAKFGKPGVHIDFGITDDDIRLLIKTLEEHQVAVVVGPTGSGKSTFLPYRLMVPPAGTESDIFTRHGQIVITQPRIQATRNIAGFVARDLHGSSLGAGFDVGYRHSGAPASDWRNKLVFVTDGTLINWIVSGQINNLSVIMIDEAHERSLNIDLILGLLKRQLPRFPHLKLIIASATINSDLFLNFFGGPNKVALLKFKGLKQHKVDAYFPDYDNILKNNRYVTSRMAEKVIGILREIAKGNKSEGDILGFLPGEALIEDCVGIVREMTAADPILRKREINAYPLYSRLPIDQQDLALAQKVGIVTGKVLEIIRRNQPTANRVMALLLDAKAAAEACEQVKKAMEEGKLPSWSVSALPSGVRELDSVPRQVIFTTHEDFENLKDTGIYTIVTDRRVIIATNLAETSLTVDGIVYVVDSGLIKESTWDGDQSASDLQTRFHSRAGCIQRMGRAGRVRDGEAHMLYTDAQFEDDETFTAFTIPEIQRSSIDQVILKAKAAGVNSLEDFDWIEPPPEGELKRAPEMLKSIGALDEEGDITSFGLELETFTTDVPVANLLVAADTFVCGIEMATLAALLPMGVKGGLMMWNRDWDATTKYAVENIRASLAAPCRDDLEFLLKLYSIWAEAESNDDRKFLCGFFFLNSDQFCNKVGATRDQFLEMMSIGKKSQEDRPIIFAMLDRLRIILLASMPDKFIYRRDSSVPSGFSCLDGGEASVEISDESILSKNPPDLFLPLKRRIARSRAGERVLMLSCLVRMKPEWLAFRRLPLIDLATEIRNVLEPCIAPGQLGSARNRLFLDVKYPLGAVFQIGKDEFGKPASLVRRANPPFLEPVIVDGKKELPIEPVDLALSETELFPEERSTSETNISLDLSDTDDQPVQEYEDDLPGADIPDDDEQVERDAIPLSTLLETEEIKAAAAITPLLENVHAEGIYQVSGYRFTTPAAEILCVPIETAAGTPDDVPALTYGGAVTVKPMEILEFPNGEKSLRVMEQKTGAEFIVDSARLSFSGRWDLVDFFMQQEEFKMVAELKQGSAIRLTCLPLVETRMRWLLQDKKPTDRMVQARIIANPRRNIFSAVLLDRNSLPQEIYWGAQFKKSDLDRTAYTVGSTYSFALAPSYGNADEFFPSPPSEILDLIERKKFPWKIFWNSHRLSLHTRKPMSSEIRDKLLKLVTISEHATAIRKLYLDSNRLRLVAPEQVKGSPILDQSRSDWDSYRLVEIPQYAENETLSGKVLVIYTWGVLVGLDRGGIGSINISKLSKNRILDPREVVYADQEVEVILLRKSPKEADGAEKIDLKLKDAD